MYVDRSLSHRDPRPRPVLMKTLGTHRVHEVRPPPGGPSTCLGLDVRPAGLESRVVTRPLPVEEGPASVGRGPDPLCRSSSWAHDSQSSPVRVGRSVTDTPEPVSRVGETRRPRGVISSLHLLRTIEDPRVFTVFQQCHPPCQVQPEPRHSLGPTFPSPTTPQRGTRVPGRPGEG